MKKLILYLLLLITAASYGQSMPNAQLFAVTGTNTYSTAPLPAATLTKGYTLRLKFANTNSGASTLNVNGLGAVPLTLSDGTALTGGEIAANDIKIVIYDNVADKWKLMGGSGSGGGSSYTFENGLTEAGGVVTLNGSLNQDTDINANGYAWNIGSGFGSDNSRDGASIWETSDAIHISNAISGVGTDFAFGQDQVSLIGGSLVLQSGTGFAGLQLGSIASDPTTLSNFNLWGNSTSNFLRTRLGGTSYSLITDNQTQTLTNKSLTSPSLTGVPTAPTAANGTATTQVATTAFVNNATTGIINHPGVPYRIPFTGSVGEFNYNSNFLFDETTNRFITPIIDLSVAGFHTSDPVGVPEGNGWYNITTHKFRVNENGTYKDWIPASGATGSAGGELSGTYPNPTLSNSAVIGKLLTSYAASAGVVGSSDNIIGAIQKIDGNQTALASNIDASAIKLPEVGVILNETFSGTLGAYTQVGVASWSIVGGKLRGTGTNNATTERLRWDGYIGNGVSNMENFTVTYNVTVGTTGATNYGEGFTTDSQGIYGQISNIFKIDLTGTSTSGFITAWTRSGASTILNTATSKSGFAVTTGDVIDCTFKLIKNKWIISARNRTTGKASIITYNLDNSFPNVRGPSGAFKWSIAHFGGTNNDIDDFVITSNEPKGVDYLFIVDSKGKGSQTSNIEFRYAERINEVANTITLANGCGGMGYLDINPAEVISFQPKKIISTVAVNDIINVGAATAISRRNTFISALNAGGYVIGTNLFMSLIEPYAAQAAGIATYNADLISTYGVSNVIDNYSIFDNGSGGFIATLSLDGLHQNQQGHLLQADNYINFFNIPLKPKKKGDVLFPVYNNENGFMVMSFGDDVWSSKHPDYPLELLNSTGKMEIHLGTSTVAGADITNGTWLGTYGVSTSVLCAGCSLNANVGSFFARTATNSSITQNAGIVRINANTGLTPPNSFTPTTIARFQPASGGQALGMIVGTTGAGAQATFEVLQPNLTGSTFFPATKTTPGAHATLTASAEFTSENNLGATWSWSTGAITTQRFRRDQAFTMNFAGASVVSDAWGRFMEAPVAGTNATITRPWGGGTNGNFQIQGSALIGAATTTPTSTLHLVGSFSSTVTALSTTTTLNATHNFVPVDATSGAVTINLPAASTCVGREYTIKKIDASVNTVTVDGNASELIDGATTSIISLQWKFIKIKSDGANWFIIALG